MDFKLRVNDAFKQLANPQNLPGTVVYEQGEYVYREHEDGEYLSTQPETLSGDRSFAQVPDERYLVRSDLSADVLDEYRRLGE